MSIFFLDGYSFRGECAKRKKNEIFLKRWWPKEWLEILNQKNVLFLEYFQASIILIDWLRLGIFDGEIFDIRNLMEKKLYEKKIVSKLLSRWIAQKKMLKTNMHLTLPLHASMYQKYDLILKSRSESAMMLHLKHFIEMSYRL